MMRGAAVSDRWRKFPSRKKQQKVRFPGGISSRRILRFLPLLVLLALVPPVFFHFRVKRINKIRLRECGWLQNRPFVCAHGGDSINNFPNTMDAYYSALRSHIDCIEIDVSRSSDGVLFALHDRDLQKISGNTTAKVGWLSGREIKELEFDHQLTANFQKQRVLTVEDALLLISESVKLVILDVKVGPPLFEKGLTEDILYAIKKTNCKNCIVWAKSDRLVKDTLKLAQDITVGYIVMNDPSTGARSKLFRIKGAGVVGVHHPLIDETLVKALHRSKKKVYAWTVDEETSMRRMLHERVDAIVTGKPKYLQSLMESMTKECNRGGFGLP